jgi:hypothetical protein
MLSFVKAWYTLCFLLSAIKNVMHGTNTTVYLQLLCQTEWLQWGLTDWGHSRMCPNMLREVLLPCVEGYWRNEWYSVTSSDLVYSVLFLWESGVSSICWHTQRVWINGDQLQTRVWSVLQDIMGKRKSVKWLGLGLIHTAGRAEPNRFGLENKPMLWNGSIHTARRTEPDQAWPSVFAGWCLF